ncbi:MAG: hypothetical protein J7L19_01945 [Dehalococcoidia bacterium]|nr:hypothetical protein [Dehalococcoidia bacterium]
MMLLNKLVGQLGIQIASIMLAIALSVTPYLAVLAQESDNETITITMTTKAVIEIELDPPNWETGTIRPEEDKKTEKDHFTIINNGNCEVDTYIKGEDAVWVDDPGTYKWELSNDDSNGTQKYALWYEQANENNYTPIKEDKNGFGDLFIPNLGIGEGSSRKFGLKLKAPMADYAKDGIEYFYEGGEMETIVTISGVIA